MVSWCKMLPSVDLLLKLRCTFKYFDGGGGRGAGEGCN